MQIIYKENKALKDLAKWQNSKWSCKKRASNEKVQEEESEIWSWIREKFYKRNVPSDSEESNDSEYERII